MTAATTLEKKEATAKISNLESLIDVCIKLNSFDLFFVICRQY